MDRTAILIGSFLIGFSGAIMPGPLLGITISASLKKGFLAGPLIILGHGLLELTLIVMMTLGLKEFFSKPVVAGVIGIVGGGYLAWMGYGMVAAGLKKTVSLDQGSSNSDPKNLVYTGLVVSATNPYFTLWWATTGMEMLRQAYIFGISGIILFFIGHILSDLTWYTAISTTFAKGKKFLSETLYQRIILVLGLFIMAFSLYFIKNGIQLFCKV